MALGAAGIGIYARKRTCVRIAREMALRSRQVEYCRAGAHMRVWPDKIRDLGGLSTIMRKRRNLKHRPSLISSTRSAAPKPGIVPHLLAF